MSSLYYGKLPSELKGSLMVRRRKFYIKEFALTPKMASVLHGPDIQQLDKCADDEARRILLGVSK